MKKNRFFNFLFFGVFCCTKWVFCCFQLGKNCFRAFAYPFEFFWHCKFDDISTMVFFCMFKLTFLNLERAANFGRSRLVYLKCLKYMKRISPCFVAASTSHFFRMIRNQNTDVKIPLFRLIQTTGSFKIQVVEFLI